MAGYNIDYGFIFGFYEVAEQTLRDKKEMHNIWQGLRYRYKKFLEKNKQNVILFDELSNEEQIIFVFHEIQDFMFKLISEEKQKKVQEKINNYYKRNKNYHLFTKAAIEDHPKKSDFDKDYKFEKALPDFDKKNLYNQFCNTLKQISYLNQYTLKIPSYEEFLQHATIPSFDTFKLQETYENHEGKGVIDLYNEFKENFHFTISDYLEMTMHNLEYGVDKMQLYDSQPDFFIRRDNMVNEVIANILEKVLSDLIGLEINRKEIQTTVYRCWSAYEQSQKAIERNPQYGRLVEKYFESPQILVNKESFIEKMIDINKVDKDDMKLIEKAYDEVSEPLLKKMAYWGQLQELSQFYSVDEEKIKKLQVKK